MSKVTKNILLAVCLFLNIQLFSQDKINFEHAEYRLSSLFDTLARGESVHIRYNANERFIELLRETLNLPGAFDYPFEHIPCMKLASSDGQFRMFNWLVVKDTRQEMEFFAILMVYIKSKKEYRIIQLTDDSENTFDLKNSVLDQDTWYGAYYSELIETKSQNKTYYTLLGWNGNDKSVNRKLIEVLTFKANGDPVFGAPIFSSGRERIKRRVFEYSRKGSMILRYDYQAYGVPVKNPKKGKPKEKLVYDNMIIFDRLMPSMASLKDNPEHYIAAGGVYDAYIWDNDRWVLKTDILAQNPNPAQLPQKRIQRRNHYIRQN